MDADVNAGKHDTQAAAREAVCPLDLPLTGRLPALLALATIPAAVLANPVFFGVAGGLLAIISLLLSQARCRCIGMVALAGSVAAGLAGIFLVP